MTDDVSGQQQTAAGDSSFRFCQLAGGDWNDGTPRSLEDATRRRKLRAVYHSLTDQQCVRGEWLPGIYRHGSEPVEHAGIDPVGIDEK